MGCILMLDVGIGVSKTTRIEQWRVPPGWGSPVLDCGFDGQWMWENAAAGCGSTITQAAAVSPATIPWNVGGDIWRVNYYKAKYGVITQPVIQNSGAEETVDPGIQLPGWTLVSGNGLFRSNGFATPEGDWYFDINTSQNSDDNISYQDIAMHSSSFIAIDAEKATALVSMIHAKTTDEISLPERSRAQLSAEFYDSQMSLISSLQSPVWEPDERQAVWVPREWEFQIPNFTRTIRLFMIFPTLLTEGGHWTNFGIMDNIQMVINAKAIEYEIAKVWEITSVTQPEDYPKFS